MGQALYKRADTLENWMKYEDGAFSSRHQENEIFCEMVPNVMEEMIKEYVQNHEME